MVLKHIVVTLAIFTVASCQPPQQDTCEVAGVVQHNLSFQPHPNIVNSPNLQDEDPDNDFKDIDTSLYRVPGEYALTLRIGSMQKSIQAVADTGSSALLIQSSTYTPQTAAIGQPRTLGYGSCCGKAQVFEEEVGLACGSPIKQRFSVMGQDKTGCPPGNTGDCPNILGLAYGSSSGPEPFFNDLVDGGVVKNIFSMLLCGQRSGSNILLGGVDARVLALQYTPVTLGDWYIISPKSLSVKSSQGVVANQVLGTFSSDDTAILDSGTTLNCIPDDVFLPLVNTLKAANSGIPAGFWEPADPTDDNYVIAIGDAQMQKLPTLELSLAGYNGGPEIKVEIPPEIYLKELTSGQRIFGFVKQSRPRFGCSNAPVIFGQPLFENSYVVFDRDGDRAGPRIGFAPNTGLCGS